MKRFFSWTIKAAAGGVIALILLCLLCLVYCNTPVHYTNETGVTEYYWEPNRFYCSATEGFGWGRTNNEGFNDLRDYRDGDSIDILMMGSSQMDGRTIPQKDNAVVLLNEMFGGEKYTYNIGMSGHTPMYCIKHLAPALERYQPKEYVIIETCIINFSVSDMQAVLDGTLPGIPSHSGGITGVMQKLPYLRLFYQKHIQGMNGGDDVERSSDEAAAADPSEYAELVNRLMEKISTECRDAGVRPMIVFDSSVSVDKDGKGYVPVDEDRLSVLASACAENDICFLDLSDRFLEGYEQYKKLPTGYTNTSPGAGHMNSWGHYLFAQGVYDAITESEVR